MNCKNCKRQGCSFAGKNHEMSFECRLYVGKTNADRIRAMSDDELAVKMSGLESFALTCGGGWPPEKWLEWLKQEANDVS